MKKPLIPTCILIAYSALLIKLLVFKNDLLEIGGLRFRLVDHAVNAGTGPANFVPFKTIVPYLLGEPSWSIAVPNLVGNIVLLVPIGFFATLVYQKMTWQKSLALAVAAGLFIEGMQAVLRVGIFDIDDVILNGLGVMVGYWIFVLFMRIVKAGGIRYASNMKKMWLVVIAAIAILVCGFAAWKLHSTPLPADNTASWYIYSNDAYKYSVRYLPGALAIQATDEDREPANRSAAITIFLPGTTTEIDIQAYVPELNPSSKEYIDLVAKPLQEFASTIRQYQLDDPNPNLKERQVGTLTPLTFAGQQAYSFTLTKGFTQTAEGGGTSIPDGVTDKVIAVENTDGKKLLIRYNLNDAITQKIVDTFTFSTSTASSLDEAALAQLQKDVQGAEPHFITPTWQQVENMTSQDQAIANDIAALFDAESVAAYPNAAVPYKSLPGIDFSLNAVGNRYLLISQAEAEGSLDEILDSQTGQITPISDNPRYYFAPERAIALYIEPQALYTYAPDQATTTLVAGSQLQGTKTYDSGFRDGPGRGINPQETHTMNNITISVFDSNKSVLNPDVPGATMYAKVGQKILSF